MKSLIIAIIVIVIVISSLDVQLGHFAQYQCEMSNERIVVSKRVVLDEGIVAAAIVIANDGTISKILTGELLKNLPQTEKIVDHGDAVILPGLVDSHVHVNEPGRTDWEGFWTATQAAAAGGVTTIVDMPLNSIPATTSVRNLEEKIKSTCGKLHVDTGFWGGLVPTNHDDLLPLLRSGVVGFKCFLCPSGVDEFPNVSEHDVQKALAILDGTDAVLAFHAELDEPEKLEDDPKDFTDYSTFLESRPAVMETSAVELIARLCINFSVRCHIVHASSSIVAKQAQFARENGAEITVETCHHYLSLNSEAVPKGATIYKCCPPIRNKANQDNLWQSILNGEITSIVSDHSPCPPEMKGKSDFGTAWGGISSLQFGLSVLWTCAVQRGVSLMTLSQLVSKGPAELCRLSQKGAIAVGKDADFVVFDPDAEFLLTSKDILHKHKLSPHVGKTLRGRVLQTVLRGKVVYKIEEDLPNPTGQIILANNF